MSARRRRSRCTAYSGWLGGQCKRRAGHRWRHRDEAGRVGVAWRLWDGWPS